MPNHVTTIIRTEPAVAKALLNEDGEVDFNLIIPEPDGVDWYHWRISNWGTKWNAYGSGVEAAAGDLAVVRFDTAWSHPAEIVAALAARFPAARFDVEYADEDLGQNQGAYVIDNGEYEDLSVEDGADEANEHAARIKYGRSYAELRAKWDAEEAEYEARYAASLN